MNIRASQKIKMVMDIPKHFAPVMNREKINNVKFYSISTTLTSMYHKKVDFFSMVTPVKYMFFYDKAEYAQKRY